MKLPTISRVRDFVGIEAGFFIFSFCESFVVPTNDALVYKKVCMMTYHDYVLCDNLKNGSFPKQEDAVQTEASYWSLYNSIANALPSLAGSILFGTLSDKYSYKIPLIVPIVGDVLWAIWHTINAVYLEWPMWPIVLGNAVVGIFGGGTIHLIGAFSYLAQTTSEESRTARVSVLEACNYIGSALGNAISGFMYTAYGMVSVYVFAMSLIATLIPYYLLWLKPIQEAIPQKQETGVDKKSDILGASSRETHEGGNTSSESNEETKTCSLENHTQETEEYTPGNHTETDKRTELYSPDTSTEIDNDKKTLCTLDAEETRIDKKTCFLDAAIEAFRTVFKKREGRIRLYLLLQLACVVLITLGGSGSSMLSYLYIKRRPLHWSQEMYTIYLAVGRVIRGLTLLVLIPCMKRFLGLRDTTVMILAIVSNMASEVFFSFSVHTWMVFMVPLLGVFSAGAITCMRSLMSQMVGPEELGKMFSVFAALNTLSNLSAHLLYNFLYPVVFTFWAGFCFFLGAVILVIPLGITIFLHIQLKRISAYDNMENEEGTESPVELNTTSTGMEEEPTVKVVSSTDINC